METAVVEGSFGWYHLVFSRMWCKEII